MDYTTYCGEGSSYLDKYGPIKINLIGRWSAIGFGDQVLHAFSLITFMNNIITKFPKLFNIDNINLYNLYGPLPHVDNIRKYDDKFCEQFYPFDPKTGKVKVRPLRLYQLNVFKYLHDIKDAELVLGRGFPEHINICTNAQFDIPIFSSYKNNWSIDNKNLIMEIIRLSKTDEVKKNGGYVNIILNCRILSTREKRREWSGLYLKDLHHNFPVDDYTKSLLQEISQLKKEGKLAGCLHFRLTDVTQIQQNDGDPTKNGKDVETCLGPQESKSYFKIKVSKWFNDLAEKYIPSNYEKGKNYGKIFIFTDDFKEAKKRYTDQLSKLHEGFDYVFCDKRSYRTMYTESWQDYLVMRECNEHCGSISMFGLWVKSYGPFEDEIYVEDHHVFSNSIQKDHERVLAKKNANGILTMLKNNNIDINQYIKK